MGSDLCDPGWAGYSAQQRAELARVRAFSEELVAAAEAGKDLSAVIASLDPDPLRFLWVDEGGGRLGELVQEGRRRLAAVPLLPGHVRYPTRPAGGPQANRPAVAGAPEGGVLLAWITWEQGLGERVVAVVLDDAGEPLVPAAPLSGPPTDCFRPTAVFDAAGRPWVFYGRAAGGAAGPVAVYARCFADGAWSRETQVSTTAHPSFNQEVIAHSDGSLECVWQGRGHGGLGIYARRARAGVWGEPRRIDDGLGTAWDPAAAAQPDGTTLYAWSAYRDGAYRLVVRQGGADALGPERPLTAGSDYALHPSVAVAGDGSTWCTFDLVTIHGHGGSGPTALQPLERIDRPAPLGMKTAGAFVPPELRPNVVGTVRAVRIDASGVEEHRLGCGVEVNPCGLPRLAATAGGGLAVAYRVLRRLPLLHYYWEVAVQQLSASGPGPVCTLADSDGGHEEPAVAWSAAGAVVAATRDGRKDRALAWTEGFGGRRRVELAAHLGDIVWNGLHGSGEIMLAALPDAVAPRAGPTHPVVHASAREEARAWVGAPQDRYRTPVDGRECALYWGDLHRHSLISRCTAADDPGLDDFYRYAWDVCEYDFWAVTDHAENTSPHQWWSVQKIADLFHVPERFVPLYGFEWTSSVGHQNVVYGDVPRDAPIFSALADETERPEGLWAQLRRRPSYPCVTIPHHPGAAMVPFDWSVADPDLLRLVEVFQSCRGNYEEDGCFRQYEDATRTGTFVLDGLRRGHRFGLIASTDHGYGASYVGCYAPALTRAALFAALHARRTLAATARGIVLDVRAGDTFMGGERRQDGPVEVRAYARGYRDLARLDVVRNGRTVHTVVPVLDLPDGWIAVPIRVEWGRTATVRDWSGELTVAGGEVLSTPYWSREVCEVTPRAVRWRATTSSFGGGGLYGPTRGGVELTVVGRPDARVRVAVPAGELTTSLDRLRRGPVPATGSALEDGVLRLQPGTGGLTSLGSREHRLAWVDPHGAPAWYYVRAYLVDGELAWSSPIWVDPCAGPAA